MSPHLPRQLSPAICHQHRRLLRQGLTDDVRACLGVEEPLCFLLGELDQGGFREEGTNSSKGLREKMEKKVKCTFKTKVRDWQRLSPGRSYSVGLQAGNRPGEAPCLLTRRVLEPTAVSAFYLLRPYQLTAGEGPSEGWLCPSQNVGRQLMSRATLTPAPSAQLTAAWGVRGQGRHKDIKLSTERGNHWDLRHWRNALSTDRYLRRFHHVYHVGLRSLSPPPARHRPRGRSPKVTSQSEAIVPREGSEGELEGGRGGPRPGPRSPLRTDRRESLRTPCLPTNPARPARRERGERGPIEERRC